MWLQLQIKSSKQNDDEAMIRFQDKWEVYNSTTMIHFGARGGISGVSSVELVFVRAKPH